jgi:Tfp pilus assembly protein PilV
MNAEGLGTQRGALLVESLVALGLLAVAMAAVGSLLLTHMRVEGANLTQTTAIALAERELEDLRALDYADIASRTATHTVDGIRYTVTTTVSPDTPAAGLKAIATVVRWRDRFGAQRYALNALYTAIKR